MRQATLITAFLVGAMWGDAAIAGPPMIGGGGGDGGGSSTWTSIRSWKPPALSLPDISIAKMPDWPSPADLGVVRATRSTFSRMWTSTKRTTHSAWQSTKHALRPYDTPASRSSTAPKKTSSAGSRASEDGGFWANLFGSDASQTGEMTTVNDFLKQPMPEW